MKKKFTSTDIAKLANVSQSTVSRALSPENAWMISREKRDQILKLCRKYDYSPRNDKKRSYHKTYKVGLLLGDMRRDLSATSFSLIIEELSYLLQLNSYTMTLINVGTNPQNITKGVKQILKSNIADIYIASDSILSGQTLDLLRSVNTRLIRFSPFNSPFTKIRSHNWISNVKYDYEQAYDIAAEMIPEEFFSSMLYLGHGDCTDHVKYDSLKSMINKHHLTDKEIPFIFQETGCDIWDKTYRANRKMIAQIYDRLKGIKVYWVGCILLAQALSDHLQSLGLIPEQDFFIITYGVFCKTECPPGSPADTFSVIGYHAETAAEKICELAMNFLETALPQEAVIPVTFFPSVAFGGKEKRTTQIL